MLRYRLNWSCVSIIGDDSTDEPITNRNDRIVGLDQCTSTVVVGDSPRK